MRAAFCVTSPPFRPASAGNDRLQLDWSSISLSRLDGGAGTDTVSFAGSTSNVSFSGSSFSNLLSNAEYLDFSNTTGSVSLSLGGDDVQKILTGSTSMSNAGVLDLKFDPNGDSLSLSASNGYSYYDANNKELSGSINLSGLNATGTDIFVYDANHQILLATIHYHI